MIQFYSVYEGIFNENLTTMDLKKERNIKNEKFSLEENFNSKWIFVNAEILSITQYKKSFYLVLKVNSKYGIVDEKSYCVMFWTLKEDAIEFKNMPFGPSGVRGFGEIPDFFE